MTNASSLKEYFNIIIQTTNNHIRKGCEIIPNSKDEVKHPEIQICPDRATGARRDDGRSISTTPVIEHDEAPADARDDEAPDETELPLSLSIPTTPVSHAAARECATSPFGPTYDL